MENVKMDKIPNIIKDQVCRKEVSQQSHMWFFNIYFSHYVTHPAAPFHKEMFTLTEDENLRNLVMVAFRNSAKSTIMTLSYPIWSIIGKQQKKFVVIVGQTQRQAKQLLINIKKELEANDLLRKDLGPFEEQDDEWGSYSLVLPWYNARISTVSIEQTIRGMRHKQYRPDLIICDDIEDMQSVKTREGRDKIYNWITGEIVPAGDKTTRMIFIGNLLHEDSLLMRMKEKINKGELDGQFRAIPLINDQNQITWPGKFTSNDDIEIEKRKIGNEYAWQREFMLKIIPDHGTIVHRKWIKYYEKIKHNPDQIRYTLIAVDPAISTKTSADYTAAVAAKIYHCDDKMKIYILPNPINRRMNFPDTVANLKQFSHSLNPRYSTRVLVESVSYQKSLAEQLIHEGIDAEGVTIGNIDKHARLAMISNLIEDGTIVFPIEGAEQLVNQIVNFGTEKHDDLVDAFTLLIAKAVEEDKDGMPELYIL